MTWRTLQDYSRGCAVLCVLAGLAGCDQISLKSSSKIEEAAREAQAAGDYPKAVRLNESLLDGTEKTADIHYRLGLLYDDKLNDPVSALHHFRRYLRMGQNEARQREVRGFIERIELVVATRTAEGGLMTKTEASRLKNENMELRKQISELREQVKALSTKKPAAAGAATPVRDAKGFSTNPATRQAEQRVGKETRTYVVRKGDTLASISRQFYNTPQRWKDIADANHNTLNGSVDLKIGQVLIIPQ